MAEPFDEGYPASRKADLDPGPDLAESLEDADRQASDEHRFAPERRRPDFSNEDEERFEDDNEIDREESRRQLAGGHN